MFIIFQTVLKFFGFQLPIGVAACLKTFLFMLQNAVLFKNNA